MEGVIRILLQLTFLVIEKVDRRIVFPGIRSEITEEIAVAIPADDQDFFVQPLKLIRFKIRRDQVLFRVIILRVVFRRFPPSWKPRWTVFRTNWAEPDRVRLRSMRT